MLGEGSKQIKSKQIKLGSKKLNHKDQKQLKGISLAESFLFPAQANRTCRRKKNIRNLYILDACGTPALWAPGPHQPKSLRTHVEHSSSVSKVFRRLQHHSESPHPSFPVRSFLPSWGGWAGKDQRLRAETLPADRFLTYETMHQGISLAESFLFPAQANRTCRRKKNIRNLYILDACGTPALWAPGPHQPKSLRTHVEHSSSVSKVFRRLQHHSESPHPSFPVRSFLPSTSPVTSRSAHQRRSGKLKPLKNLLPRVVVFSLFGRKSCGHFGEQCYGILNVDSGGSFTGPASTLTDCRIRLGFEKNLGCTPAAQAVGFVLSAY